MRIVYTDEALRDLDETLNYIAGNYPAALHGFRRRLRHNPTAHCQMAAKR
jgi:plasmid stabilization system protein ParE